MIDFTPTLHDATWHDYPVYRPPWSASKLVICDSNATSNPLFFANPSLHHHHCSNKPNSNKPKPKPDITLHAVHPIGLNAQVNTHGRHLCAADGKAGPVVATAHFRHTRRTTGLAFGDPVQPDALHWETMTTQGKSKGRYSFALPPADAVSDSKRFFGGTSTCTCTTSTSISSTLNGTGTRPCHGKEGQQQQQHHHHQGGRALTWKRTHSLAAGLQCSALSRRLSMRHWKLVDDATGAVVALFEASGVCSARKTGTLRVRVDGDGGGYGDGGGGGGEMPRLWWEEDGEDDEDGEVPKEKGKQYQHEPLFLAGVVLSYCVIAERTRREG